MSNLTTFEIVAGAASIISLLFVMGGFALNLQRRFKEKQKNAEHEFERELDRLRAAERTVSARTDLGFFVLIELGALRNSSIDYRQQEIIFFVLGVLFLLAFYILVMLGAPLVICFSTLFMLMLCFINASILHFFASRLQKFTRLYEHRIKEVWQRTIDKRVTPNDM